MDVIPKRRFLPQKNTASLQGQTTPAAAERGRNIAASEAPPPPPRAEAQKSKTEKPSRALSWEAPEMPEYKRGPLWYALAGICFAILIFFGILRRSFIEVVLFSFFGIFLLYLAQRKPESVRCTIDESGVSINKYLIPWEKLDVFNIIYIPGQAKRVLLRANKFFLPLISIELGDADPVKVREALLRYLPEDPELQESFADTLARRLKL
jgi:hypothetical protein